MAEETNNKQQEAAKETKEAPKRTAKKSSAKKSQTRRPSNGGRRGRRKKSHKRDQKPDFKQKILNIRRVTRVMSGGRRFSFSVLMVLGDESGRIGVGIAKANDTSFAIQKAANNAKKNMVKLKLTDTSSIPYEVQAKFNSARVNLRPNFGRGVVSGSAVRTILELAGVKDVSSKVLSRSKNQLNIAQATLKALDPFIVARGKDAQKGAFKGVVKRQDKDAKTSKPKHTKKPALKADKEN